MTSRLAELYSIISPAPGGELLSQREEAIVALSTDENMRQHFAQWIDFVLNGTSARPLEPKELAGVNAIVSAIRHVQPSFPADPAEKGMDLRVTALAVLERYLKITEDQQAYAGTAASLILSGSLLRQWDEAPLATHIGELRGAAQRLLDEDATLVRARVEPSESEIGGGDVAAVVASANSVLGEMRQTMSAGLRADREELQVLWWLVGKRSRSLGKPFSELDTGNALIAAASELASMMLLPPAPASQDFLQSILAERKPLPLSHVVSQASLEVLRGMGSKNPTAREVSRLYPTLLPMTWLAERLIESERSPWEQEFEKRAHISSSTDRFAMNWADQFFLEKTATRFIELEFGRES